MLDASSPVSAHLQGVTRHSPLHVSSRKSFTRFLLLFLHFLLRQATFRGNFLLFRSLFVFLATTLSVLFACFARFFAYHTYTAFIRQGDGVIS